MGKPISPNIEGKQPSGNLNEERRSFLKKFASATFAGMVLAGVKNPDALAQSIASADASELPPPIPRDAEAERDFENILLRMQEELRRALTKPLEQRRWVMVIDLRKCVGCHACTVSCKAENKLPPGVVYRPVIEEEFGTYPNVGRRFIPRPCMQCDEPPCVPVCPVSATYKRPDGVVEIDYNACIGCRYCITACPYNARTFDFGDHYLDGEPETTRNGNALFGQTPYESAASFEYGKKWEHVHEQSPIGNARKCHFCLHRISVGMLPACTTTCIGGATYFGDANDPDSLVSELISKPNVMRLKEEFGTKPKVYYLM